MPEYKLLMIFKTATNGKHTLTIADVRPNLTEAEAMTAMDAILAADLFQPKRVALVSKLDCKMVETTQSDFYNAP